jgi:peptidoglycan/LPS O-acetylase OafA/YrhL
MNFGQMGVQLFFVLSALSLCISMERLIQKKDRFLVFYIKRYFRIAPLYYLGIIMYFLISFFDNFFSNRHVFESGSQYTLNNILYNVFFMHGFVPEANNNIVPGGWSIGTEMAFYILFPFLFILLKRIRFYWSIFWMVLISLVCFSFVSFFKESYNLWFLYYNLINMLPVFILAIFYYMYLNKFNIQFLIKQNYVSLFVSIISLIMSYFNFTYYHSLTLTPFLCGLTFVIWIDLFKHFAAFNHTILVKIGQLSYSMYIFHFIFAHEFSQAIFLVSKNYLNPQIIYLICFVFTLVITFFIALISEKLIEAKGVKYGAILIRKLNFVKNE